MEIFYFTLLLSSDRGLHQLYFHKLILFFRPSLYVAPITMKLKIAC